jgi:tetratricopeptide (TPR) repeat protein
MNSILLKNLFIFITLNVLYANDTKNLQEELTNVKIQLVKLQDKFDKYDSIIDRQDKRIGDFGSYITITSYLVTMFGIVITLSLLIFGFSYGQNVKNIAKDEITDWIDTKAEKELKSQFLKYLNKLKKESKKVLTNIQIELDKPNKEQKEKIDNIDITQPLSNEDTTKLEEEIIKIDKKDKKDFSFNEWYTKFLAKYYKKEYEEAFEYLENSLEIANNNEDMTKALYSKGVTLGELGESQKEIGVYDILINEFKDSKSEYILEQVAKAYLKKGVRLGELGESQKEIGVYDILINEFKDSKSAPILEQVAKAYLSKGVRLGKLREFQKEIDVYDILIKEFNDSKSEYILEQATKAYNNKVARLKELGKSKKDIDVYDIFIKEIKDSKSEPILEQKI